MQPSTTRKPPRWLDGADGPRTITVYAATAPRLQSLRRQLPLRVSVVPTTSLELFSLATPAADCAVVSGPSPSVRAFAEAVSALRDASRELPIVIVPTDDATEPDAAETGDASAARWCRVLPLAWNCSDDTLLWAAIQGSATLAALRVFDASLRAATHLRPPLRDALLLASGGLEPVVSVGELAAALQTRRRVLWRGWRSTEALAGVRLDDVIDWLLVLRAGVAHARGVSWTGVAETLGVDRHTLARAHRRLVGLPLADATFDS
ncbi:MAG: hypothetical protein ABJD07_02825 [Gemmatimonadaceae bacterium]